MTENEKRVEILFRKHHNWLLQVATNTTRNSINAEEFVQNLYLYLLEKGTPNIYYADSFNLKYCYLIINTRFINYINKKKLDIIDNDFVEWNYENNILNNYDYEQDEREINAYDEIINTINHNLKTKKNFTKAKVFSMYYLEDNKTLKSISKKTKLSETKLYYKLNCMKKDLRKNIENPYKKNS